MGKNVSNLEKNLAEYVNVEECITCASGTDSLLIPLMAKDIGHGDAVFTTNFSFFATSEVISLVGATPVFIDIDSRTFNIDINFLEESIKQIILEGELIPKAIIAVDLFGQLADYLELEKIAKKYNLLLIEDGCQSFGATFNNRRSCSFGDVAATSFFPAKPLGCYGDGGAIFTNDKALAEICRSIRVHGQGTDKYDNVRIGLNSRLDELQAVILLNKLKIFNEELLLRENIANYYSNELKNFLIVPVIKKNNVSSWAQYSLLAKSDKERDELTGYLNSKGIPTAIYYKKIFSELDLYKNLSEKVFPVSKNISKLIFSIPMHPYLEKKELDYIVNTIKDFFNHE